MFELELDCAVRVTSLLDSWRRQTSDVQHWRVVDNAGLNTVDYTAHRRRLGEVDNTVAANVCRYVLLVYNHAATSRLL